MLTDLLMRAKSNYVISVDYLRALRSLHTLMVSKQLDPEYPRIISNFRGLFDACFRLGMIKMTPKIHLLYHHLEDHMRETNETLWYADTSGKSCSFPEIFSMIDLFRNRVRPRRPPPLGRGPQLPC